MNESLDPTLLRDAIAVTRPGQAREWALDIWSEPFRSLIGVFAGIRRGRMYPIGTSFGIGRCGLVISATHNVEFALRGDPIDGRQLRRDPLHGSHTLRNTDLAVVTGERQNAAIEVQALRLEHIAGSPPSDVVLGAVDWQHASLVRPGPVSLAVPRIGSTVTCLGICNITPAEGGVSLQTLSDGSCRWGRDLNFELRAVEGTVKNVFLQRFASGFVAGPCFTIDTHVYPGQSGGPVVDQRGYICGTVWATASSYFERATSLCALLYPILLTPIQLALQIGPISLSASRSTMSLIDQGLVTSDGKEHMVAMNDDEHGIALHPAIHVDDVAHVFDDFRALLDGRPPERAPTGLYRFRKLQEGGGGDGNDT